MTAEQLIKRHIIMECGDPDPGENVDQEWELHCEDLEDHLHDFRYSGEPQDKAVDDGRYYSSRQVYRKLSTGETVGWTYYFGGGKHGEPGAIDWVEDAYLLEVTKEMRPVKVFKRIVG